MLEIVGYIALGICVLAAGFGIAALVVFAKGMSR